MSIPQLDVVTNLMDIIKARLKVVPHCQHKQRQQRQQDFVSIPESRAPNLDRALRLYELELWSRLDGNFMNIEI